MDSKFFSGNRNRFYEQMLPDSVLVLFAGNELRKTNDEYYPFFAHRSFVYMTGIEQKETILVAVKGSSVCTERVYTLPSDPLAERWTGRRLTPENINGISGVTDVRFLQRFKPDLHALFTGDIKHVYLDLYKASPADTDRPSNAFLSEIQNNYPYLSVCNADAIIRKLRLVKQPCEIEAMRKAEKITGEGIVRMMQASRPGMYEYHYKAEFDYVLGQYGPCGPGFPPIISAGRNNFCIHYYSYTGCAAGGDMILNDVGAQWDNIMTDVSRGFPCNGHFSDKQRLLYDCALKTSDHMFSIVKPGLPMDFIDKEIRRFNAEQLKDAGVLDNTADIARYMWHGGAHHVGYDVHDVVKIPEAIAPGMVFCIDVGIYHEEWGIGFRLEDNLLVTENGCENLSADIPRTTYDIESVMRH